MVSPEWTCSPLGFHDDDLPGSWISIDLVEPFAAARPTDIKRFVPHAPRIGASTCFPDFLDQQGFSIDIASKSDVVPLAAFQAQTNPLSMGSLLKRVEPFGPFLVMVDTR